MRNKILLAGLLIVVLISLVFAEIPTPLKDVGVVSVIKFDGENNLYTYTYSVSNPQINNSQIAFVQIDISRPEHSKQLSSEGLMLEKGFNLEGKLLAITFDQEMQRRGHLMDKAIIPVGLKVPIVLTGPSNWFGDITVMGTVMFGGSEELLILPGKSTEGFIITSHGLPGFRDASVKPLIDYDNLPEEYYENVELTKQLQDSLEYHTKTIGPTAPPDDFIPLDFLDYVISLKHEAYSLGWIKNKGIEQGLDAKLDAAKKKLSQGNTKAAKDILGAFVNEVEAQGCESYNDCPDGKHLTPEAYALLKYNALYLAERL